MIKRISLLVLFSFSLIFVVSVSAQDETEDFVFPTCPQGDYAIPMNAEFDFNGMGTITITPHVNNSRNTEQAAYITFAPVDDGLSSSTTLSVYENAGFYCTDLWEYWNAIDAVTFAARTGQGQPADASISTEEVLEVLPSDVVVVIPDELPLTFNMFNSTSESSSLTISMVGGEFNAEGGPFQQFTYCWGEELGNTGVIFGYNLNGTDNPQQICLDIAHDGDLDGSYDFVITDLNGNDYQAEDE